MNRRTALLHSHPRLVSALIVGFVIAFALPPSWDAVSRALVGWNVGVWAYLGLMGWLVAKSDEHQIHRLAKQEDSNAAFVLAVMSLGAVLSLAAIVAELASARNLTGGMRFTHYAFTAATVFGSWLLVGTIYSFHYAHLFYRAPPGSKPLRFPDDIERPGYWDFLYFSFTIAVAAQTSDISVMSPAARKAVLAQSVLSFLFNAAIIGMTINIAASVIA